MGAGYAPETVVSCLLIFTVFCCAYHQNQVASLCRRHATYFDIHAAVGNFERTSAGIFFRNVAQYKDVPCFPVVHAL
jgi:hypothetical protein